MDFLDGINAKYVELKLLTNLPILKIGKNNAGNINVCTVLAYWFPKKTCNVHKKGNLRTRMGSETEVISPIMAKLEMAKKSNFMPFAL